MDERLTGKGVLSSGDKQWNVEYDFVITTSVVRKPGFPAVQGRSSSIGSVSATDGASLAEGYYQLRTGRRAHPGKEQRPRAMDYPRAAITIMDLCLPARSSSSTNRFCSR